MGKKLELNFESYTFQLEKEGSIEKEEFVVTSEDLLFFPTSFLTELANLFGKEKNIVVIYGFPINVMEELIYFYHNKEWNFVPNLSKNKDKFTFVYQDVDIKSFFDFVQFMDFEDHYIVDYQDEEEEQNPEELHDYDYYDDFDDDFKLVQDYDYYDDFDYNEY
jgi:hypothetical protein